MRHLSIVIAAGLISAPLLVTVPADAQPALTAVQLKAHVMQQESKALAAPSGGIGNGIYQVYVEQSPVLGPGSFTVLTGADNPAGAGHDVLFGNGVPGTSYLIIRRTTADGVVLDYVQGQLLTHATELSLDPFYAGSEPIGTTGYVSTWNLDFGVVKERVEVVGTTPADTAVEVTTTIDPEFAPDDEFQVQYIWDVAIGADDGPVLQELSGAAEFQPFDPTVATEQQITSTTHIAVADNDGNPAPPNLATAVSATGPVESLKYVCWPDAIYAEFGEYEVDPSYDISTTDSDCINPDGHNDSAAVLVWPVGQNSVTASLAMTPSTPYPASLAAEPVLLRSPPFTATLRETAHNTPLAGRTVEFLVGTTVRCTAVTDAEGVASCGTLGDALAAVLALGYTARYGGGAIWSSATDDGGLL